DIKYNGTFDINNLKITNAKAEVLNNKLIIKYGDEVVKEYNLIQKSNILGDVNGDGQITITDMTIQYKHVKYAMDLVGDEEYRANVNKDEDVSITDVLQLYKYIKNKITGF
ncbi:MAG: dockerin type I repeat-containing protein, partial [Bacilli bacterium]